MLALTRMMMKRKKKMLKKNKKIFQSILHKSSNNIQLEVSKDIFVPTSNPFLIYPKITCITIKLFYLYYCSVEADT
jgi:hypothetical protein